MSSSISLTRCVSCIAGIVCLSLPVLAKTLSFVDGAPSPDLASRPADAERGAIRNAAAEAAALYGLARRARDRGRYEEARSHVEGALRILESIRARLVSLEPRTSYFSSVHQYYDFHVDVLMRMHDRAPGSGFDREALHVSERARARSLFDLLLAAGVDVRGRMWNAGPRRSALTQPSPLTGEEIQREVADSETAILVYWLGEWRSVLWVVSSGSIKTFSLPRRGLVEPLVRAYRAELVRRGARGGPPAVASRLSALLLGGALAATDASRLVIVADSALCVVPFGALPVPGDPEGTPLVVRREVLAIPSASTLVALRRETAGRAEARDAVAVFADPVFDAGDPRVANGGGESSATEIDATRGVGLADDLVVEKLAPGGQGGKRRRLRLPRLPGTRAEAQAIVRVAGEGRAGLVALDFDADKARVMSSDLRRYRYVHFATHGLVDTEQPALSSLVFSTVDRTGKRIPGFLRLQDVFNLELGADLVVLSACETGLGREVRGEGLVGLTRGFMYAGARSVVASLWPVDDAATAELMEGFYGRMLRDGMAPSAALRAAQVETWKKERTRAPYFWAAFVVQGDWLQRWASHHDSGRGGGPTR